MSLTNESLVQEMRSTKEFFDRSTRPLSEADSNFAPREGMYTVAQQVAHTAQTVEWFLEGAFRPEGFDMNFEAMAEPVLACKSLHEARLWLDRAFQAIMQACETKPISEWLAPLPPNPLFGEIPRVAIISSIVDHSAHHRGALTVYSRLLGYTPPMPYMDM
jgi:uncharacterized damage-inducible protein DinB